MDDEEGGDNEDGRDDEGGWQKFYSLNIIKYYLVRKNVLNKTNKQTNK